MANIREKREELEKLLVCDAGVRAEDSLGRLKPEPEDRVRTCFQRDIDRITHSKAFRRLKQKTQVFLEPEGDHYRTRLTHTLEVTRIARTIARALCLNEDLTEAIGLGHDLGHTPFGHAGERALNELLSDDGGFRHYEQSLRVVDAKLRLEMGAERMLAAILEPLREEYDYILIDTCPSLGALNINAMAAADEVIVTVNPQLLAMMGLQDFLKTVRKIRNRINSRLNVAGILLTMCDARTVLCRTVMEQMQETFQGQLRIFGSRIPNTVKVGESVYYREPLTEYAPESNACRAYEELAKEVAANES